MFEECIQLILQGVDVTASVKTTVLVSLCSRSFALIIFSLMNELYLSLINE